VCQHRSPIDRAASCSRLPRRCLSNFHHLIIEGLCERNRLMKRIFQKKRGYHRRGRRVVMLPTTRNWHVHEASPVETIAMYRSHPIPTHHHLSHKPAKIKSTIQTKSHSRKNKTYRHVEASCDVRRRCDDAPHRS
jgi:hypothetical protein